MHHLFRKVLVIGFFAFWMFFHIPVTKATKDAVMEQVADGIFVIQGVHEQISAENQGSIGNTGFIVGQDVVAVIDPGGSQSAGEKLKQRIRQITDLPIEYLILTHFHPDHVAAAMAFADTPNVIAHENYARAVTQRAEFYVERFPDILQGTAEQVFRLPSQSVAVGQAVELDLGGRKISLEAHPLAHTDNDLTVHDLGTNTFWASDLVFAQRTPSLDGSLKGWLQVLAELDARNYALTIPGHGEPEDWEKITASQISYLEALRDSVRRMISDETPLSDVLREHDQRSSRSTLWKLYAAQHGSNLAKAYTELEWE